MSEELIKKLVSELNTKLEEIKGIQKALETIREITGETIDIPDLSSFVSGSEAKQATSSDKSKINVRPDMFYGKSCTEATEGYLRVIGHAVSFDDICHALKKGGIQLEGDFRKNLNTQLTRATRKFAKIGKGTNASFGLIEWYPKKRRKVLGKGKK